jgi:predicted metalloprotease with PDZ domain
MTAVAVDEQGFGRYRAADYDELIDHPVEIGTHATVAFEAAGVPHRLVVAGRFEADLDRVATDLIQLCSAQIEFFGRPAPFPRYTFLGLAVGEGYGGLEHRDSSSLIFRRTDLPKPGETGVPRDYQRFLGLVSHEYFHSWHIKRSKPAAFMPYRLDRRNHTRLLWVFEGITSYYQERFLLTSGLLGAEAYLRRLAELMTRVLRVPGRKRQSLAESSFNAWDHLYKPDADSANRGVSYYSKGALVALALDLKLRRDSESRTSLDDVVRALWQRFGSRGVGLPEDGFEALAIELGGDGLAAFFDRTVRGTEDPDFVAAFADFGIRLAFRQASGPKDPGGTPPAPGQEAVKPALGAALESVPGGSRITTVADGGAAQRAGLAPGDIIAAIDRYRVTMDTIQDRLGRYEEEDVVSVSYFRDDELCETSLTVTSPPLDTCYFEIDATPAPAALARRRAWLGR